MGITSEPQVWVLIGVFAAAIIGVLGVVTTSFNNTLRASLRQVNASIDGLRGVMGARFDEMDAKFEGLRADVNGMFAAIDIKVDSIDKRLDNLDRDVQTLTKRAFGTDV
ncbi:hypothetical protein [Salinibacterium sp. ZJ450]|uniref:hypothetical protein n=1 Tax=Salinibacterium sp. ZJ450 TaxID=2708338 RepID=UPI00141E5FE9|nr:hypothetical protein [Salinibacterium sp. ZJ450]